jgi:hypothetical protein
MLICLLNHDSLQKVELEKSGLRNPYLKGCRHKKF